MNTLNNRGVVFLEISKRRIEAIRTAYKEGQNPIAAAKEIGLALEETKRVFQGAPEELNALYPGTDSSNEVGNPALALNALTKLKTAIDNGVEDQSLSLALSEEEITFLKRIIEEAKSAISERY